MQALTRTCALLLVAGLSACEQAPPPPALPVASDFYQAYLTLSPDGVPDAQERATLTPLISAELLHVLADIDAAEVRYAASHTEPQPPLVQGDLFSSLFEGATGVEVKACKEVADAAACDVLLTYAPAGQSPTQWRDVLLLVWTAQGWRVDDIEYGGDWPFGNKGSLRANLKALLQAAPT